ncbi:glycosyl transferase family protein [Canicola haemoglobinophilus]|nr:glycosyl transferase family protein [Canicola haemoglobinophilus]
MKPIFELDINNYFLAAVSDDLAQNLHGRHNEFNAGVMLINNKLWKSNQICDKAIYLSNQYAGQMPDGDQTILNLLFKDKWLELSYMANYLVGGEFLYLNAGREDLIRRKNGEIPIVLHFNTEYKPWYPIYNLPFREFYWFYYQLSWEQIIRKMTE